MLLALGTTPPTWHGALLLGIGIVLVTILGEPCRMLILRQDKGPAKAEAKAAAD